MTRDKVELYWSLMELLTPEEKIRLATKLIESVPEDFEVDEDLEAKIAELKSEVVNQKAAAKKKRKTVIEDEEEEDETAEEIITDERKVKPFVGIDSAGCLDVQVSKGDEFRLAVIGRKKDIKHIKTSVRNNVLHVFVDPECGFGNSTIVSGNSIVSVGYGKTIVNGRVIKGGGSISILKPLQIEVTMPKLESLHTQGSGDINVQSDFSSDRDIVCTVEGSGNINLCKIECDGFGVAVKGSGNVDVKQLNTKGDVFLAIKGSGDIDITSAYVAGDCELQIQGSGDIRINGSANNVDAYIFGSGDISGNLKYNNISTSTTGSGELLLAGYHHKLSRFDF